MKKIIIVECISTSMIYVSDIRKLGYEPVILETYNDDGGKQEARRQANYKNMEKPLPRRIQASPVYEETLEMCKAENPVLLLPGSEMSVELATKLANDLGLLSNPAENLPQMTRKSEMHKALKRAGLRYIKGKMVSTADEALDFYHKLDKDVVLKPTHSAGSLSVHVCNNDEQVIAGFNEIAGTKDMFGGTNDKVLIQERIKGKEYIVNTISCEGENYPSAVYVYKKVQLPGGANIYIYDESLAARDITPEIQEMMDYAQDVVKAIGIKYGPVHGEYMIDEDGPVLIEVNCRICGGDMTKEFLDAMFGHHETNLSLEAYLDKDKFNQRKNAPYNPSGKGFHVILVVKEDMDIIDAPVCRIAQKFPTSMGYVGIEQNTPMHLKKTTDLYSNGGKFLFAGSDIDQVIKDAHEFLRLEDDEYDSFYTKA